MNPSEPRLVRVLTALLTEPWLLTPVMHRTLCEIVLAHAAGGEEEAGQHAIAAAMLGHDEDEDDGRQYTLQDGVALIPCEGVIGRKFSDMLQTSGVVSVDVLARLVDAAASDDEVGGLVLVFDSPGGVAMGIPEAANAIARAKAAKPVVAYVDGQCCSGAYWLASGCDAVLATPSAEVGSIGAYIAILDRSRQAELEGVRVELFRSGRFKGMAYPGTSMSDEQRDLLRDRVQRIADQFKAAVREGRTKQIPDGAMEGQSFSVNEAQALGLVDEVADLGAAVRDCLRLIEIRGK